MLARPARSLTWLALPALLTGFALQTPAWGNDFAVNSTDNALDAKPGDGVCETAKNNHVCTLRGAVAEMMANPGGTITLPAGVFTLNTTGTGTPNGALVLTGDVAIEGAGASSTILDGASLSRIIQVQAGAPGTAAPSVKLANLTLRNGSTLAATAADDRNGGAVDIRAGKLTLSNAVIKGNNALQHGGGIHSSGSLELLNSTFDNNTAGNFGGAVSSSATLTVQRSALYNNQAFEGGALAVAAGNATLSNSTFANNNATDQGGAIYVTDGNVVATNLTITGNVADVLRGAGIGLTGGSLSLANSIVALNGDPSGNSANCDPSRAPVDGGHNIQFPATSCGSTIRVAAPQLGVLGDHGGGTQTVLPLSTSPAIDAIDDNSCSLTDQRGSTRVDGNADGLTACDIGATEFVAPQSPKADLLVTVSDSADPVFGTGDITYTITVENNGPATATGVIVTDILPKNVTVVSLSTGCAINAGTVRCSVGELAVGAQKQYQAVVRSALQTSATYASRAPKLSVSDVQRKEGNSGTTQAEFTVKLSPTSTQIVTVDYATTGISATAGSDFMASSGKLIFAPGETSKTVSVKINGDTVYEPNETLSLDLSNPVRALLAANSHATATIENDDSLGLSLSPNTSDVAVNEPGALTINLERPAPAGGVAVALSVIPESGLVLPARSVSIAEGQKSATVTFTAGAQAANAVVISATSAEYTSAQTTISVRTRSLRLALDRSPVGVGGTATATVESSLPAPAGGLNVTLKSKDPCAAIDVVSARIAAGQTAATFEIRGISPGICTIEVAAIGHISGSKAVTVTDSTFTVGSPVLVGQNLQAGTSFRLNKLATSAVNVTLTVKDRSIVSISSSATDVGSDILSFAGIGDLGSRNVFVHGLMRGRAEILVAAEGYAPALLTVEVHPSGFVFGGSDITSTPSQANTTKSIEVHRLTPDTFAVADTQPIRAGYSTLVTVAISDSNVGAVAGSPVTFGPGKRLGDIDFDPISIGTATMTITQPTSFTTPKDGKTVLSVKVCNVQPCL